jgi:hypothetical protein
MTFFMLVIVAEKHPRAKEYTIDNYDILMTGASYLEHI